MKEQIEKYLEGKTEEEKAKFIDTVEKCDTLKNDFEKKASENPVVKERYGDHAGFVKSLLGAKNSGEVK